MAQNSAVGGGPSSYEYYEESEEEPDINSVAAGEAAAITNNGLKMPDKASNAINL